LLALTVVEGKFIIGGGEMDCVDLEQMKFEFGNAK